MSGIYYFVSPDAFLAAAVHIARLTSQSQNVNALRFTSVFGTSPEVFSAQWLKLPLPRKSEPRCMLFSLIFPKFYDTESVHATLCNCDESTFRHWAWLYVAKFPHLKFYVPTAYKI